MPAQKLQLRNPAWKVLVASILGKTVAALGINEETKGVTAKLSELILYDPSGVVTTGPRLVEALANLIPLLLKHCSSPLASPGFGFLDITLPSRHRGGKVKLKHGNDSMQFSTHNQSEFNASYLAWVSLTLDRKVKILLMPLVFRRQYG